MLSGMKKILLSEAGSGTEENTLDKISPVFEDKHKKCQEIFSFIKTTSVEYTCSYKKYFIKIIYYMTRLRSFLIIMVHDFDLVW